jgi:hypothetical protein
MAGGGCDGHAESVIALYSLTSPLFTFYQARQERNNEKRRHKPAFFMTDPNRSNF